MSIRKMLMATALTAVVTGSVFAAPSGKYASWPKGPEQFLMTREEVAQWKQVTNDEQAKAFIDLFWARRDPTPGTPQNEFHDEFDVRVKYADDHFPEGRKRGALTDRGKVLVLFGGPTSVQHTDAEPHSSIDDRGFGVNVDNNRSSEKAAKQIWFYVGDKAKPFNAPKIELDFVDEGNTHEYTFERGNTGIDLGAAQLSVLQAAITQPSLTAAPRFDKAVAAPVAVKPMAVAPAAAPAAPAVTTEFKTPAFKNAVESFKGAKTSPYKPIFVSYGEYVTTSGEYYVPVSLYSPKGSGLTAADKLTFFGYVEDSTGKTVAVFEEPAMLSASGNDFYYDKSLTLPAGKFKGTFGLANAGTPVAMVSTEMTLAGALDKSAPAVSNLILSNNLYPMTSAQRPTDPFAFGGIKVVPKSDKTFTNADELWYFFELRNPGVDEAKNPKVQIKLDLEGTATDGKPVKMSAPSTEAPAQALKGVEGHYGVGSSIPLAKFKAGDYTLKIRVTDTITKASYNLSDTFRVVGGSEPSK